MMNQCTRRLSRVASHFLAPHFCTTASTTNPFHIHELVLGDSQEGWQQAGFAVDEGWQHEQLVFMDNCTVRLTSKGHGLSKIVFGTSASSNTNTTINLPGIDTEIIQVPAPTTNPVTSQTTHPNSATRLGELVLYTQCLDSFVAEMSKMGLDTYKNKDPKLVLGNIHACAKYFVGDIRLLVFGPVDPTHDSTTNPTDMWMLGGQNGGNNGTEITGYLHLVDSMSELQIHCANVGPAQKAMQKNRTIATLKAGSIDGLLSGTFAFLSDGKDVKGDPLF